jgi:hypothetical protein
LNLAYDIVVSNRQHSFHDLDESEVTKVDPNEDYQLD